jgi:PAS domain-containing protein
MGTEIDYEKLAQLAHEISGAEVSVFNLFDEKGKDFTTLSIQAEPGVKKKALDIIDQKIIGRTWPEDKKREALTGKQTITYFDSLIELTNGILPDRVVQSIERMFDLGHSAVAKIEKDGKVLGDFNLIFKKGEMLQNEDLFRIYLSQLGLFIEKTRLLKSLNESQKRFHAIAENAPVGFISCNRQGEIKYVNRKLLEIMDSPILRGNIRNKPA